MRFFFDANLPVTLLATMEVAYPWHAYDSAHLHGLDEDVDEVLSKLRQSPELTGVLDITLSGDRRVRLVAGAGIATAVVTVPSAKHHSFGG